MSATGFFIFTIISGIMACYILYNVFSTCTRYQELRKRSNQTIDARNDGHLLTLNSSPTTASASLSLQGLKSKTWFFVALFLICFRKFHFPKSSFSVFVLVRTLCLILMTMKFSELNQNSDDDAPLNVLIRLLLDLPTLILISVFSAFAYYLSSLNMEVETIMQEIDEMHQNQNQGG